MKEKQDQDPILHELKENVYNQKIISFEHFRDGVLRYHNRLFVPMIDRLKDRIIEESHIYKFSIHTDFTKIYHDLTEVYW